MYFRNDVFLCNVFDVFQQLDVWDVSAPNMQPISSILTTAARDSLYLDEAHGRVEKRGVLSDTLVSGCRSLSCVCVCDRVSGMRVLIFLLASAAL